LLKARLLINCFLIYKVCFNTFMLVFLTLNTRWTDVRLFAISLILKTQWVLYVPPALTFTILRSAHTVYLCVLYGSQNK